MKRKNNLCVHENLPTALKNMHGRFGSLVRFGGGTSQMQQSYVNC